MTHSLSRRMAVVALFLIMPAPDGGGAQQRAVADAVIAGHVTDARSAPVSTYSVIVFPTDRAKWSATSRLLKLAAPSPDGGFEVGALPAGEYWVAAIAPVDRDRNGADWQKPETLDVLSTRATRVILREHQRSMTVLRLIRP
jgi:hypothetical protein